MAIVDEVVEGVVIAAVGELVVGGREFLKALKGDGVEVSAEFGELGEDHGSTRDEGVDQRLLLLVRPHRVGFQALLPPRWLALDSSGDLDSSNRGRDLGE